jgi:1,4-dihydroxy-2-naphthoate octaprenyltransferase
MNFAMWGKALKVIPSVTKEEWLDLDFVSKWLISTRAAVLVMTFLSAALAGLFALRDGGFQVLPWLALALGLILAHATNNLFNDYTDYVRGVDENNYFRAVYGPQPLTAGLFTKGQSLRWAGFTGLVAAAFGVALMAWRGWDLNLLILLALGAFFVLAYTWPLKHLALGEVAVIIVWGPLMIGGGYYALTGAWNWNVILGSLPYSLSVTTVIFGKHIDKLLPDKAKRIHTLPVLIGETASRWAVIAMMVASYLLVGVLIAIKYFTPVMALVLVALPLTLKIIASYAKPRPTERPAKDAEGWPLYLVRNAFVNNKKFGTWFLLGLILDTALRLIPATSGFWR